MRTLIFAAALSLIATAALAGSETTQPSEGAMATETPLLEQSLAGMEGKKATLELVEVPPGFETPRHMHPANVFVYVLEGAVEIDLEGQEPVTASAGEVVYEAPNHPMVGRNVSSSEGARLLIVYVGDADAPLTVPQE